MQKFLYKFAAFMQGRYGFDELGGALIAVSVILNIVSRFFYAHFWVRFIMQIIAIALLVIFVLRFLSTKPYNRSKENDVFKPAIRGVIDFFKLNYKRLRDGRTHRYYKCPACKAQLRVKNIKGKHTIRCPKCGNQFEKTIR